MNNQSDNAAAPSRTTVRVPTASGDELEAWLYLPEGDGPHPAVVMAHGIGAIKAGGLAPFAERFCHEGFAAVVFDYRQWCELRRRDTRRARIPPPAREGSE